VRDRMGGYGLEWSGSEAGPGGGGGSCDIGN
jgi:hypothetical protein